MRTTTLAAALSTLATATARITSISAPRTLAPNTTFPLTLHTTSYIQSITDVSIAWGYSVSPYAPSLGSYIQTAYLGEDASNTLDNITIQATVPAELSGSRENGTTVLSAAVTSLYGKTASPSVWGFEVRVQVGAETSTETVESEGFAWIVNQLSPQ